MNNISNIKKWLFLNFVLSKSKLIKLYDYFKSTDNIFEASGEDYKSLKFLKPDDIKKLCEKDFSKAEECEKKCISSSVHVITRDSEFFPDSITKISNFPSVLFCKGKIENLNFKNCVSVVGTRTPDTYGKNITYSISSDLSDMGFCIVSGMADGVDSIAHKAAIDKNEYTVAVVGCGPDIIYPKENMYIYEHILKNGMIISEYPPGTKPDRFRFPERNKIIAALSHCTIVTEANIKSGSLITANLALKYKNELFAVPGNATSRLSEGTNDLLKKGAHMILRGKDVYDFYEKSDILNLDGIIKSEKKLSKNYDNLSDNEKIIIKALEYEELSIDSIIYKTGLSLSVINSLLLIMELKEIIKKTDTDTYMLVID